MDTRVWTDNCPACGNTCRPTDSAVHGKQHMAAYACGCGRVWMTTRDTEAYDNFEFPTPEGLR